MPLREFPKRIRLRDGSAVTLRPMVESDEAELLAFFCRLSPEDRQFLRDDVTRPELIRAWCRNIDYNRVLPILAECEGRIIGDAALKHMGLKIKRGSQQDLL